MVSCLVGVLTEIWHSAGKEKSCIVSAGLVWPATPTEGSCFRPPTHHSTVAKTWTYLWDPDLRPKKAQFCTKEGPQRSLACNSHGRKVPQAKLLTHHRLCRSPCISWNSTPRNHNKISGPLDSACYKSAIQHVMMFEAQVVLSPRGTGQFW